MNEHQNIRPLAAEDYPAVGRIFLIAVHEGYSKDCFRPPNVQESGCTAENGEASAFQEPLIPESGSSLACCATARPL